MQLKPLLFSKASFFFVNTQHKNYGSECNKNGE